MLTGFPMLSYAHWHLADKINFKIKLINCSCEYRKRKLKKVSVRVITKTGLLFSNLHTPIKKREGFFKERFTRDCGEPATWIVFPLKSPAIVILSDSRKRNDKVGFRGQCLSVRWAECPSHLGRQACVLSTLGQRLSCKEKAGKVNSQ